MAPVRNAMVLELFRDVMCVGMKAGNDATVAADQVMMEKARLAVKDAIQRGKFPVITAKVLVRNMLVNASAVMVVAKQHSKSVTTARAENLLQKFRS
ncbi:MAG: hypothetical protein ACK5RQ_06590 [Bacteroidota bacterium]